jgi:hypothetical protein
MDQNKEFRDKVKAEAEKNTEISLVSSSLAQPQPYSSTSSDPDEINLLEYIYVLVKNKWWIIGAALIGIVLGHIAAKIKGPTYVSEAVIAAKESDSQKGPNLSGLGALGGLVAGQLNVTNNPGLDKIDLILSSRKFNAELIDKCNLLPILYKEAFPKVYNALFDTVTGTWKKDFIRPNILGMGGLLSGKYLKREANKNNTMTIKIESKDSVFSDTLLSKYIVHLNEYIKNSVQNDANENVAYLNSRLETTGDPLLREKLQGMIANELEKAMLVSKEAFRIIDPPIRSYNFKAKKTYPVILGMVFSFLVTVLIIIVNAIASALKTSEDKILIAKIKRSLFL